MRTWTLIVAILAAVSIATPAVAQRTLAGDRPQTRTPPTRPALPSNLPPVYVMRPMPVDAVRSHSWTYIDQPQPRTVRRHDIIKIIVDEKSEVTLRSGFDRQMTTNFLAELREFVRIGKTGNLENAAFNSPTIDANVNGRMRNQGRVVDQEGMRYRIAATVVNVLPNGNVVLYARKAIRSDRDSWKFVVTGIIPAEKIRRDGTALSEDIAELEIVKERGGKVYSSTKWRWGTRLYDLFWPF